MSDHPASNPAMLVPVAPYGVGEPVPMRVYNYPWAGRFGRVARCCLHCGEKDAPFGFSSFGTRCLRCRPTDPVKPELQAAYDQALEQAVDAWCAKNNIDRAATEARMHEAYGGPPNQDFLLVRTDAEVKECLEAVTPAQWEAAKARGFTRYEVEFYFRFGRLCQPTTGASSPFEGPPKVKDASAFVVFTSGERPGP